MYMYMMSTFLVMCLVTTCYVLMSIALVLNMYKPLALLSFSRDKNHLITDGYHETKWRIVWSQNDIMLFITLGM